jgi:hypothetical protein
MKKTMRLVCCLALAGMTTMTANGCAVDAANGENAEQSNEALAYGTWGTFQLGGRCLDLQSGSSLGHLQAYDCNGGSNQKWTFANPNGPIISDTNGGIAATFLAGVNEFGVSKYAGYGTQLFTMPKAQFVSGANGSYCLSAGGPNNEAVVESCGYYDAQQWTFDESLTPIKNREGLCLTTSQAQSEASVYFTACGAYGTAGHQNWQLSSNGSIRQNGYCLDIRGGSAYPGAAVQIYNCNSGNNQRWKITGQLDVPAYGACMGVATTALNAQPTALISCTPTSNNTWSFVW